LQVFSIKKDIKGGNMKKLDKRLVIISIIIIVILLVLALIFFINKNKDKDVVENVNEFGTISYDYEKDADDGMFLIVSEIKLNKAMASTESIYLTVNTYDEDNNLIKVYTGNGSMLDFKDETDIKVGSTILLTGTEMAPIDRIEVSFIVDARRNTSQRDYAYQNITDFTTKYDSPLYRVYLDIDDNYKSYGGIGKINYENSVTNMEYISYLESLNFVGIAEEDNIFENNDSPILSVDLYQTFVLQ